MLLGLLPLYVAIDTARALLTYALLHSGVRLSPTTISLGFVIASLDLALSQANSNFILTAQSL